MSNILSVKNLTVKLGGKTIIENVSFNLRKGESLAIIGPNGSGKTVLLSALLKIIPYTGDVSWAPNIKLGYVPQKIEADRGLPINLKNLLSAKAGVLHLPCSHIALTEEVGLQASALNIPIGHLSGGQFQRALIAFALLGNPDILLFDEPTASIDQPGERRIYELIHKLQDTRGIATIVVSHDLNFVYRYADNVLCLNKEGLCLGKPEEVLTPEILSKLYGEHHKYYHHVHFSGE
jgi:zinc transport system ATP-binding protein